MRTVSAVGISVALGAALAWGAQAGQSVKGKAPAPAGQAAAKQDGMKPVVGPVELKAQPSHVGGRVEAFPLVVAGPAVSQAAADRINASLRRAQATVDAAAAKCPVAYREQLHAEPSELDLWQRGVDVGFKGPRYLELDAYDETSCGGSHPNDGVMPLVYDLTTGAPVNWVKLFPPGMRAVRDSGVDGSVLGVVVWPLLSRRAIHGATGECAGVYSAYTQILWAISLDGREGVLKADGYDIPRTSRNCEDIEVFSPAQMRKMGFAAELADAVEAAHKLQR